MHGSYSIQNRYHMGQMPTLKQWVIWYALLPWRRVTGWKAFKSQFPMQPGAEMAGPHRKAKVTTGDAAFSGGYWSLAAFNCGFREYR